MFSKQQAHMGIGPSQINEADMDIIETEVAIEGEIKQMREDARGVTVTHTKNQGGASMNVGAQVVILGV